MNTAIARRLSIGDQVIWVGNDDSKPRGPGTITRITAHQIEVWWEGQAADAIDARNCTTFDTFLWPRSPRREPDNPLETDSLLGGAC
jgi:hypothetical protein